MVATVVAMSQRFCTESLIIVSNVTEPTDDLESESEVVEAS